MGGTVEGGETSSGSQGSVASGVLPTFRGTVAPTCKMGTQGDMAMPAQAGPHKCVCTRAWSSPPTHSTALGGGRALRVILGWPGCWSFTPSPGTGEQGEAPGPQAEHPCPCSGTLAGCGPPVCLSARPPRSPCRLWAPFHWVGSLWLSEPDSANQMFSISHLLCVGHISGTWHRG